MRDIQLKRRGANALLLSLPLLGLFAGRQAWAAAHALALDDAVAGTTTAFMADPRAVGLSVGVIWQGRSHRYHFGTVSKRHPRPADDRTIYPIASLTKTFTGTLLAQAQCEGKLKLDDDIRDYLGGDYPNLAFEGRPIRIYHLANHRSGLPLLLPGEPETSPYSDGGMSRAQRPDASTAGTARVDFHARLHRVQLTAEPGRRFQYSNAAAQLAGYILERVYGSSFGALVRQRIAVPQGMRDTSLAPTAQQQSRLAAGYDEIGALQPHFPEPLQAAGGLMSTLADMLAYARWQLAEQDPAVRLSHQPTYRDGAYATGLNWQILTSGTRRVIFQDGSHPGFASLLALHPESGIAIVLLANEIDRDTLGRLRAVANGIVKALDRDAVPVP